MYIIYSQDYDNIEFYFYTANLEKAKDYSELMGYSFKEINILPERSEWPKKIPYIRYWAECWDGKLKIGSTNYYYYSDNIPNNLNQIVTNSPQSIVYYTDDLSDKAKQYFNDYMSKFKILVKPGSNGTLNVIGFQENVETN